MYSTHALPQSADKGSIRKSGLVPTSGYHKSIFSPFAHLFSNPSSLQPSTEQACRQQPGNIFLFFGSYRQQQAVSHKQPPLVGRGFEIFARSVDFVTSIGFQADESAAASVATRGPWPRCRTFGVTENLEDMLKPWPWFVSCLRGKANFKCALLSGPVLYSSVRTEETA